MGSDTITQFIVAILFLMPLAFYPSFRMTGVETDFTSFWMQIFSVDAWPVGPAWFIWVLLAMNIALLALVTLREKWGQTRLRIRRNRKRSDLPGST
jgi:glucans biosynthesis protein C